MVAIGGVSVAALKPQASRVSSMQPIKPHDTRLPPASWHVTSLHLPMPLQGLSAGTTGVNVYVAGGINTQSQSTVWKLRGSQFMSIGSLPQPVHDAAMVVSGQCLFMIGGGTVSSTPTVQEMNLGAGYSSHMVTPLPAARSDFGAVFWRHYAYLVGGHGAGAPSRIVWRYKLGGRAVIFTRLPIGVRYAAVAGWQGIAYVVGGLAADGVTNQAVEINLTTGQEHSLPPYPEAIQYAEAFVLKGTLWVAGGRSAQGWTQETYRWDPTHHTWVKGPLLPMAAGYGAVAAVNAHQVLWIGGRTSGHPINAVWKFTL